MGLRDFLHGVKGRFRDHSRARSEASPAEGWGGVGLRSTESTPNLRTGPPTPSVPGPSILRKQEAIGMRLVRSQMLG